MEQNYKKKYIKYKKKYINLKLQIEGGAENIKTPLLLGHLIYYCMDGQIPTILAHNITEIIKNVFNLLILRKKTNANSMEHIYNMLSSKEFYNNLFSRDTIINGSFNLLIPGMTSIMSSTLNMIKWRSEGEKNVEKKILEDVSVSGSLLRIYYLKTNWDNRFNKDNDSYNSNYKFKCSSWWYNIPIQDLNAILKEDIVGTVLDHFLKLNNLWDLLNIPDESQGSAKEILLKICSLISIILNLDTKDGLSDLQAIKTKSTELEEKYSGDKCSLQLLDCIKNKILAKNIILDMYFEKFDSFCPDRPYNKTIILQELLKMKDEMKD